MHLQKRVINEVGFVNKALEVGQKNHGYYRVLPRLGVIDEPIIVRDLQFLPREMDSSQIPWEADRQIKALENKGVLILQQIVGHNLKEEWEKQQKIEQTRQRIQQGTKILHDLAVVGGVLSLGILRVALSVITFALVADPWLIAVLEDGTWLVVAEWDS